jgi:signal transduction histidine kinase/ActR/RegA family two-component response regulator
MSKETPDRARRALARTSDSLNRPAPPVESGNPGAAAAYDAAGVTRAVRVLATMAALLAAISLSGWISRVPALAGALFGSDAMVPLTAVVIALASVAILLPAESPATRRAPRALAAIAFLIAVGVIAVDAFRFDSGSGLVLSTNPRGLPAPNTAFALALVAAALLLERPPRSPSRRRHALIGISSGTSLLIGVLALIGYAYGADALVSVPGRRTMAMNTALSVSCLSFAILLRRSGGGLGALLTGPDAGAQLARALLPALILVPFALGLIRLLGDREGLWDAPHGTAFRTIAEMGVFAFLTLVAARRLREVDREREQLIAEEQAQELEVTVDELRSANESLEVQQTRAEKSHSAEVQAKHLLDAVIDQLPAGVILARIPSGEIVRRNRKGQDIATALSRASDAQEGSAQQWNRADGTPYTDDTYPLTRTVRDAEVIDQEEMFARMPDGSTAHLSVSSAPIFENDVPVMAVVVFKDITTRRAAEAALADRDAMLRSFFSAPEVMFGVVEADVSESALASPNVDYRFLLVNKEGAGALEITEPEMAGHTASQLGVPVDRRRSFVDLLAQVHRGGKPITVERPTLPRLERGPQSTWYSMVVTPLATRSGDLPQFCIVGTDVSRRRHLEEELRQAQKLEAVGRLAGGIAHDFNNLLTAITGFTRFALSEIPSQGLARDDLEQALRAAERAAVLTHQLLAFSRQQVLQPQVIDLNQVVSNIEPMLRRVIGEDIAIHRSLAASLGNVRADRGQIEQVLVNLVVNARDSMPDGGLLTIETADVYLESTQMPSTQGGSPGPHIMLAVTDTGSGMSAETRDRIFEPFFTTKGQGQGTGLGLSTVFGIVNQSGGSIWVYSEPGHGTTFKIYLPRYDGPVETPRTATPIPTKRLTGRVLLVEDDRAVRMIAARVLRRDGYEVVEATNGREGFELYRKMGGRVELIVTDLVLPEMGGRAMIRAMEAEGPVPPVIYMSGYTAEAMSAQSILAEGDHFLEKPFTTESMLAKVRETLQASVGREPRRAG